MAILFALPALIMSEVITMEKIKYCTPYGYFEFTDVSK